MSESNRQDYEKKNAQYQKDNRESRAKNSESRDKAVLALSSVATGWLITIREGSDISAFADWALFAFGSATFSLLLGYALIEKCTWVWDPEILASSENQSRKREIGEWCQKVSLFLNYVAMAGALCGMILLVAWKLDWDACWVYGVCAVFFCAMIVLWAIG